ncbi:MAG: tetratricopeptide repeat protein [Steroidobacteraceae bacterium]
MFGAPLLRSAVRLARDRTRYALAGGLAAAFAVAAAIIYVTLAARHPLEKRAAQAAAHPATSAAGVPASAPAESMQAAISGLEARLAREGGTDADWTLLAKAYDFQGRPDDARRARAHIASPAAGLSAAPASQMSAATLVAAATAAGSAAGASAGAATPAASARAPAASAPAPAATLRELQRRVKVNPRDVPGWLALAELYRAQHADRAARDALAKVVALNGMTAQSWADYADVLASLAGGSLAGAAAGGAIDRALALDPANPKALWLKASQAHEERHFADALGWWRKLRAVLPADSPDRRIIDGNITEDTQLGGFAPLVPQAAELSGTVSVDARLAGRVQRDATLFIYAKAADSPGPPLAVLRTTASAWPVSFRLDDSMAMIASRRLSQFNKVVVEARISRSGQAVPASGDLYVTSPVVNPLAGKRLALVINREIG